MFGCSSWFGRWNDGGLCAVLLCDCVMSVVVVVVVAVAVVFVVCLCLVARVGVLCHPRGLVLGHDASHRRQYCCASIEDRAYSGVKLHLAACRRWVGRWDDGGLSVLLLLHCCELFVVAIVVAAVVLFLLVSMFAFGCWCARPS